VSASHPSLQSVGVVIGRNAGERLKDDAHQQQFRGVLNTIVTPSSSTFITLRQLEHRQGEFSVLELEVNQRCIHFDAAFAPDYAGLVLKLGDTESVALALGGPQSAAVLAVFVRDDSKELARRRLGVINLGLMGSDAAGAREALLSLTTHSVLGADATQAIKRI
jgi:hypothetical protein